MTDFWETWAAAIARHLGSWGVEILGGLILATVVQVALEGLVARVLAALCLSLLYELFLDPNGMDWVDVGQRAVGIALGLAAWGWLG